MDKQIPHDYLCGICLQPFFKPIRLKKCSHKFCEGCIDLTAAELKQSCPLCRTEFKLTDIIPQTKLQEQIKKQYPEQMLERKNQYRPVNKYRFEMSSYSKQMRYGKHEWGFFLVPFKGEPPLKQLFQRVQIELETQFSPQIYTFDTTQAIKLTRFDKGTFKMKIRLYYNYKRNHKFECSYTLPMGKNKASVQIVMRKSKKGKKKQ